MTNHQKRSEIAQAAAGAAWALAIAEPQPVEDVVVVLGEGGDADAQVFFHALGASYEPGRPGETNMTMLRVRRARAIAVIAPHDPKLATILETPTPMRLTVLVLAFGGWSTCAVGRNVGLA